MFCEVGKYFLLTQNNSSRRKIFFEAALEFVYFLNIRKIIFKSMTKYTKDIPGPFLNL